MEIKNIKPERGILVLDIDDTLLTAQNIYIHKTKNGIKSKLTPDEFAKDTDKGTEGVSYDYKEFLDESIVKNSILTGIPIIGNLKTMDQHIQNGWSIAILTARGLENVIYESLSKWLMFEDDTFELKSIQCLLTREMVFAVNDTTIVYNGNTDFEKKAIIIERLSKEYDRVKFLDDDIRNIDAVNNLNLENVEAIKALVR